MNLTDLTRLHRERGIMADPPWQDLATYITETRDLTCPLCGETGFDAPGISRHWDRWCAVNEAIGLAKNNGEVAANLKAQGMETRQGGDAQQAPSHSDDSPVPQGCAPTTPGA